ncbi:MAG: 4Fe-4S binding protein [Phycisphaeraceae bacterium]|nr:4Fe-4S binding protein [Phycisphaeraceae bacterium]
MVCNDPLDLETALSAVYLEQYHYLCSEAHRLEFKSDPAAYFMHRMWGIPDWLYYVSIALMLVLSFGLVEGGKFLRKRPRAVEGTSAHIDLLQWQWLRRLVCSRILRFFLQAIMAVLFVLILAAGLFGHQNPALNIAPLLTWTIWWCGLVVLIMFAGKAWCTVCPWDAMAGWMERMRLWKKTEEGLGLGLTWPRHFQNITLATIFFVGLTWVELGFGVTMSPRATAYLGLTILLMAIVSAFLFDRKSFCRYGCLVGRVSGLYALFAGIEVRARSGKVCQDCKTRECVRGSDKAYACPTFEKPFQMQTNTYCIQCTECIQACPHDNMTVNLRPWGADLAKEVNPRSDEAYLCLLMLSISAFHGLTMTPIWRQLIDAVEAQLSLGRIVSFSLSMGALLGLPILVYAVLVWLSYAVTKRHQNAQDQNRTYRDYFIHYAYCLLPIALFYHLAHNLEHLLMEGPKVIARLSDPFGWNWNLLGTANWQFPPLVSLDVLWILQVVLVGAGHIYSLWAAQKITHRFFAHREGTVRGQFPILLGMIAFSILSLWLLKQPMEMRSSAM